MLVNGFEKAALVLSIIVLSVSMACAAPKESVLLGSKKSNTETSLERDLENGVTVTCEGVSVSAENSFLVVNYTILSEEDTIIKAEAGVLFDNGGEKFDPTENVYIGKNATDPTKEREIVGGVKTPLMIVYPFPKSSGYKPTEKYARVSLSVNGENLTFRDVPFKKETALKKVEEVKKKPATSLEREIEGGIKVICHGIIGDQIHYTVITKADTTITVRGGDVFDNQGNRYNGAVRRAQVGNQTTQQAVVIADVPTLIIIRYNSLNSRTTIFPRVWLFINGQELFFQDVPRRQ
jgi:hypothetical protein